VVSVQTLSYRWLMSFDREGQTLALYVD